MTFKVSAPMVFTMLMVSCIVLIAPPVASSISEDVQSDPDFIVPENAQDKRGLNALQKLVDESEESHQPQPEHAPEPQAEELLGSKQSWLSRFLRRRGSGSSGGGSSSSRRRSSSSRRRSSSSRRRSSSSRRRSSSSRRRSSSSGGSSSSSSWGNWGAPQPTPPPTVDGWSRRRAPTKAPTTKAPTPPPSPPTDAPTRYEASEGVGSCVPLNEVQTPKESAINIVFLPSGFGGNMTLWREKVDGLIYSNSVTSWGVTHSTAINSFPSVNHHDNPYLNIFRVDAESELEATQETCPYGCNGFVAHQPLLNRDKCWVARRLCCNRGAFRQLAEEHCGAGNMLSLVAVKYDPDRTDGTGGANLASITHRSGLTLMHELGHSLFGLADEYQTGNRVPNERTLNCALQGPSDGDVGCPRWADLLNMGMEGVQCVRGCKSTNPQLRPDGDFYTSNENTILRNQVDRTVFPYRPAVMYPVNERFACCKYLFHGHAPAFCAKWSEGALDLMSYCTEHVWNGQQPVSLELLEEGSEEHLKARAADPLGVQWDYISNPVAWNAVHDEASGWSCHQDKQLPSGLYRYEEVHGERGEAASDAGGRVANVVGGGYIEVDVLNGDSGQHARTLGFHRFEDVEELPEETLTNTPRDPTAEDFNQLRTSFRVLLNQGEACSIGS